MQHHAYAYRLGPSGDDRASMTENRQTAQVRQFWSPEVKRGHKLLGVVVRYFGGTKLGVGGLIDAYRTATLMAIDNDSSDSSRSPLP